MGSGFAPGSCCLLILQDPVIRTKQPTIVDTIVSTMVGCYTIYKNKYLVYTIYSVTPHIPHKQKGRTLMKKLLALLLSMVFLFGSSGCLFFGDNPYPYRGAYKEQYTAAIYSIPDAEGYMHHGEGAYNSVIHIWEQDDYGRTLFSYCEDYGNQIFGLVLCQTYDESNVYFDPDANYVLTQMDSKYCYEGKDEEYLKTRTEAFYLENRDLLKESNDWNKPLDKSKCVSYPITDHKDLGENVYSLRSSQCDEILNAYSETLNLANPDRSPHRYNRVLQVDAEGKVLHQISGDHQHHDNPNWKKSDPYTYYSITLWVITDQDGNYDEENGILVMYSKANEIDTTFVYDAEEILEFKNRNGWKYN